ncbi:hypothetical protein AA0481_2368 [Acetobacter orientalis NRIC 0481]|uniref:Uncharacterized protein n=1 Tax=Acetobacter orientalis TaxID=146474 RepID=A0A0D6NJ27_9PROT|nr:hypothetical protein Abor_015_010 [Acetobacter orientalis]GBR21381.1 hypothetical protein AA0481_2368 [Acetobacter orientalis NRIC 0481]
MVPGVAVRCKAAAAAGTDAQLLRAATAPKAKDPANKSLLFTCASTLFWCVRAYPVKGSALLYKECKGGMA